MKLKPVRKLSNYRKMYPEPKDRIDGVGGRRIVVRRIRSQVYLKNNNIIRTTNPYVVWRRPYSFKIHKCLLKTWARWVKQSN